MDFLFRFALSGAISSPVSCLTKCTLVWYNIAMYTKCLKYRLCPTKAQETVLDQTLLTCRDVYNSLLNERKHDYETKATSPSRYEQQKHFPAWSKEFPEIRDVFSQVLQNVAARLDLAFKAFFRRVQAGADARVSLVSKAKAMTVSRTRSQASKSASSLST